MLAWDAHQLLPGVKRGTVPSTTSAELGWEEFHWLPKPLARSHPDTDTNVWPLLARGSHCSASEGPTAFHRAGGWPGCPVKSGHLTDATSASTLPDLTASSSPSGKARLLTGQRRVSAASRVPAHSPYVSITGTLNLLHECKIMSPEEKKLKGAGRGGGLEGSKSKRTLRAAVARTIKSKMGQKALKLDFGQEEKALPERPRFL